MPADVVLPFPRPIASLRHARSTVLIGSVTILRDSSRWTAYLAALPANYKETLFTAVAGTWIPVQVALAHYAACDAMQLPVQEQVQNGGRTFDRVGASLFGTMLKMAKEAGVTPWAVLGQLQRFWMRGYDGGGIQVTRTGPKDARLDLTAIPLLDSPYFRNALRGLSVATLRPFAGTVYMSELPTGRQPGTACYRVQWA